MTYGKNMSIPPGPPVVPDPDRLAGELRVAVLRTARCLRNQRGEADLSESQFSVVAALAKKGPMTPGALAEHEHTRPPSMTRTVNTLVELGLVTKVGDSEDRRLVVVDLTDAGRDEVDESRRRRDAWLTRQLGLLTDDERRTLLEASALLARVATR